MQISPLTATQPAQTGSSTSSTSSLGGDDNSQDMFISLLTAQLKSQDPLSPMDPTAFVGQLVQFNTLGQIMQIRELLQQTTSSVTGATDVAQIGGK